MSLTQEDGTITLEPAAPTACVILIHGLGDSAEGKVIKDCYPSGNV
jgi:hypothetical protein